MSKSIKMAKLGFEEYLSMAPFSRALYARAIELIVLSVIVWLAYSYLNGWQFFAGLMLLALGTLIITYLFWVKSMWKLISIALFLTGIIGIAGVFWPPLLRLFMLLQVILLLIIGLLFVIFPDKFQRE